MYLMITVFAAIISTVIWYFNDNARKYNIGMLTLMYWGAALMWIVDGIFCVAKGEAFFKLSFHDAELGVIIVICGLATWLVSVCGKKCLVRINNR